MKDGPNIVRIAALVGDHARAEILTALMAGEALTATELAGVAGVTKQTVSAHLANLLESLMGVAHRAGAGRLRSSPREPALRKARVCYDHLAGDLGVLVFDSLDGRRWLRSGGAMLELTPEGRRFCRDFGIDVDALAQERRPLCRACLDWSVRRHHLAGALGAAVLKRCLSLGWARRAKGSRVVMFSGAGERALRERFSLPGR